MDNLPQKTLVALVKNSVSIQSELSTNNDASSAYVLALRNRYTDAFNKLVGNATSAFEKADAANRKKAQLMQSIMNFSNAETIAESVKPLTKDIAVPKLLSHIKKASKNPEDVVVLAQHLKALIEKSPRDFQKYKEGVHDEFKTIESLAHKYNYTKNYLDALTMRVSMRGGYEPLPPIEQISGSQPLTNPPRAHLTFDKMPARCIFFSDEEGNGDFLDHLNKGKFKGGGKEIAPDIMLVYLGDAVDRGDRGEKEIQLVQKLLHLKNKDHQMLLLAGNRDVTKLRLRFETAIIIEGRVQLDDARGDVKFDAYDVLHCISKYHAAEQEDYLEKFVKFIANNMRANSDKTTNSEISYAWIALAYQWLTRNDACNTCDQKVLEKFVDEIVTNKLKVFTEVTVKWMFHSDIIARMWTTKQQVKNREGMLIDQPFFTDLKNNLAMPDIARVEPLLRMNYGIRMYGNPIITNKAHSENKWIEWAKAGLKADNNGLFLEYLINCDVYHTFKIGDVNIYCAHAIPTEKGMQENAFRTNSRIESAAYGIQQQIGIISTPNFNSCLKTVDGAVVNTCGCAEKNNEVSKIMSEYIREWSRVAPSNSKETAKQAHIYLNKVISQATGLTHGILLDSPVGYQDDNQDPTFCAIDSYFGRKTTESEIDYSKCYIVHGHQPQAIPFSADATITVNGDLNIINRISVDVSNDGDFSGEYRDYPDGTTTVKKNWAYVEFKNENGNAKISAYGSRQGIKYTIPDLTQIKMTTATDSNDPGSNTGDKPFFPYKGFHKDSKNENVIYDLFNNINAKKYNDASYKIQIDQSQPAVNALLQTAQAATGGKSRRHRK